LTSTFNYANIIRVEVQTKEENIMTKVCEKCGKKPMTGHNVSHSHRKTKRRFLPNLQYFKPGKGEKRIRVCAQCLRSM